MTDLRFTPRALARLLLELALASFTLWLIVQNALLLAMGTWKAAPVPLVVAGTLVKVSLLVLSALWPWMLASLLIASALAAGLTHAEFVRKEARHG